MNIRKIPLKQHAHISKGLSPVSTDNNERQPDDEVDDCLSRVRMRILADRALNDQVSLPLSVDPPGNQVLPQAAKAFVSFVRAYSKHQASYIFRIKDLDLIGVAKSFGLLRLPRMPELQNVDKSGWTDAVVDVSTRTSDSLSSDEKLTFAQWDNYAYADKAQEAKRLAAKAVDQATLEKEREQRRLDRAKKKKANTAWSEQTVKKEERVKRREKRAKKKKWLKEQQSANVKISESSSNKRPHSNIVSGGSDNDENDWDELAKEERMAKKLRKGEISQREFDAAFSDL